MSAVEQGGKVAVSIVDGLSSMPTLLVMVILNTSLISASTWYLNERGEDNAALLNQIISRCFPHSNDARPHGGMQP